MFEFKESFLSKDSFSSNCWIICFTEDWRDLMLNDDEDGDGYSISSNEDDNSGRGNDSGDEDLFKSFADSFNALAVDARFKACWRREFWIGGVGEVGWEDEEEMPTMSLVEARASFSLSGSEMVADED